LTPTEELPKDRSRFITHTTLDSTMICKWK
jgi:hypothetical protein